MGKKKDKKSDKSKQPKLKAAGKKNPKKDSRKKLEHKPPKKVELKAAVVDAAVLWWVDPTSEAGQQALIDAVEQLPIRSRPQLTPHLQGSAGPG